VDIVEVISAYLPLKRAGRNFKATCPFHHEKTPSFMVSPDKQIFHCFGCGESGNAFKFLMKYERVDFPEAVESLARKAGVVLPQAHVKRDEHGTASAKFFEINEWALEYFQQCLFSSQGIQAVEYFKKRGITKDTAREFKLGFAPPRWDGLLEHLKAKGVSLELMEKAGLVLPKEKGGYYDRFRNRTIFPIFDVKARPLGFGGRVLDEGLPKYLNSPETPVYVKGRQLFGLQCARDYIREKDCAVVVEGYLDAILPFQFGIKNIVATLGTAMTPEQVRLLKRFTHNVVMIYDPDNAGQMATLRSLDIFLEEEMEVRVVSLPAGLDPDLYVRKHGAAQLQSMIDQAPGYFSFQLGIWCSRYNPATMEGKAKIASELLQTVAKCRNLVLQAEYLKMLAERLQVDETVLRQEMKQAKLPHVPARPAAGALQEKEKDTAHPTEKLLVTLLLDAEGFAGRIRQALSPQDFQDEKVSKIVSTIFRLMDEGKTVESRTLLNHFDDDLALRFICQTAFQPETSVQEKEKIVDDCIRRMKQCGLQRRRHQLHERIKDAQRSGDEVVLQSLMREFQELLKSPKE
jgi:DNA primase